LNRKKINVGIKLDKVVFDRVNKYTKMKGLDFDAYVNRILENRMNFIIIQRDNALRIYKEKKGR